MIKKLLMPIIFLSVFLYSFPVYAEQISVRIGIYQNEPKIFVDDNGKVKGFFIDILEHIASEESWKIEYVQGTWAECLQRLRQGEIDLLPDIVYTKSREEYCSFNKETALSTWSQIYTRKFSKIKRLVNLKGKRIAVMKGAANYDRLKKILANFRIKSEFIETDNYHQVFGILSEKKADAGVVSHVFGWMFAKDYNLLETGIIFSLSELKFATKKGENLPLLKAIDAHLIKAKEEQGSFVERAYMKWIDKAKVDQMPWWIKKVLIALLLTILFLSTVVVIFKLQLKRKTSAITEKTRLLENEINEHRKSRKEIEFKTYELEAVNNLLRETFSCTTDRDVAKTCLSIAEKMTGSTSGFIGEINKQGRFDILAINYPGGDPCKRELADKTPPIQDTEIFELWKNVLSNKKSLIVNDLEAHPDSIPVPEGYSPLNSFLGVPLIAHDSILGIIALTDKENGYTQEDAEAVQYLSLAFIEMLEKKRIEENTKMMLRFQETVAAVLSRFIAAVDINQAIRVFLTDIGVLCNADRAYLFLLKDKGNLIVNTHEWCADGIIPQIRNFQDFSSDRFSWLMKEFASEKLIHFGNVSDMTGEARIGKEIMEARQAESFLIAPVFIQKDIGGFIGLDYTEKKESVNDAHCFILETTSEIIGNALTRKKNEEEIKNKSKQMESLFEMGKKITSIMSEDILFHWISVKICEHLGTDFCNFRLKKEEYLVPRWSTEKAKDILIDTPIKMGESISGRVAEKRVSISISENLENNSEILPTQKEKLVKHGIKSLLSVPMVMEDDLIGVISVYSKEPGRFNKEEVSFLSAFADLAAVAVKNAEYLNMMKEAQKLSVISEKLASVGRLAAGVTHEILNPLNIIKLRIQLLMMEDIQDKELLEAINIIKVQVDRIQKISQALLSFSRQKDKIDKKEININDCMKNIIILIEKELSVDNIKLRTEFEEKLPPVFADANQLTQVFLNLINNAKDAMTKGGELTISTDIKTEDSVLITIKDTGTGIPEDIALKIFDPFFTTKEEGKGTGLGLSVCHNIIEAHQGKIWVENNKDMGASFFIELPIKKEVKQ